MEMLQDIDTTTNISLEAIDKGHHLVTYKGVKCAKSPFDYVLYQILINTIKPDLIIEIGANEGGSALYMADLLTLSEKGMVHTIDVADRMAACAKAHPRIQFYNGGWEMYDVRMAQAYETVLVIEDSSHTYNNTLKVLNRFAPLVTPGSYFVVEDGIIDALGMSPAFDGGPIRAIKEFLETTHDFVTDTYWCDFFGKNATFNTIGYLKRLI
jgi:cephalosporin hydroxylase